MNLRIPSITQYIITAHFSDPLLSHSAAAVWPGDLGVRGGPVGRRRHSAAELHLGPLVPGRPAALGRARTAGECTAETGGRAWFGGEWDYDSTGARVVQCGPNT